MIRFLSATDGPTCREYRRAVSTVADVSLALVILVAAITVPVTLVDLEDATHDESDGPHTAETIGASTINGTYSVKPVTEADIFPGDPSEYDAEDYRRVSHGTIAGEVATSAISNVEFDVHMEPARLTLEGVEYESTVDETVQTSLVESNFETNITGFWEPFGNASVRGFVAVGQQPPPDVETSLATLTVSSGMETVRDEAVSSVGGADEYDAVADIVAEAVIEGLLPELETQHALERNDLERDLAMYRAKRLATVIDGISPDDDAIVANLERERANATAIQVYLSRALSAQFETELESEYETAYDAASAVSVAEIAITVRTWET